MAKYSFEFKLKLVHDYLSGQGGLRFLAKKYGFKDSSQISKWINAYKELGEEGLRELTNIKVVYTGWSLKIIYEVGDTVVFTDAWFPAISGDTAEIVAEEILPKGSKIYSLNTCHHNFTTYCQKG